MSSDKTIIERGVIMALINCPECNKEVSDKALSCPNCGYPIGGNTTSIPDIAGEYEEQPDSLDETIRNIIEQNSNNKVAAVKMVHAVTGLSLSESKKRVDSLFQKSPSLNLNKQFKPRRSVEGILIDDVNRLWKYGMLGQIIKFEEIQGVELYENGSSVSSSKTGSMIGRAAVGSLICAPAAIVGGLTGKKKSVDIVNELFVLVSTINSKSPIVKINLNVPKKTTKDSKTYSKLYIKAKTIESTLNALNK
jgi:uncharacterized Zn finger protein (UPF0148 family)